MQKLDTTDETHLLVLAVSSTGARMLCDGKLSQELKSYLMGLVKKLGSELCPVCGWKHDEHFYEITILDNVTIHLPEVPARLVKLVHSHHEQGIPRVGVKDSAVLNACGGYQHPCKVFGDLDRKSEYKLLIDTSSRGFISLRKHQPSANRKHSQSIRNDEIPSFQQSSKL